RLDRAALRAGERPQLREMVDEDAVALVRRYAAGGRVRRGDEVFVFELCHVVADRRGRDAEGMAVDDRLAADRLVRLDIVLHDRAEHLQSTFTDHHALLSAGT